MKLSYDIYFKLKDCLYNENHINYCNTFKFKYNHNKFTLDYLIINLNNKKLFPIILTHIDKLSIYNISYICKLDQEFIDYFIDYLNLNIIQIYQSLTEDFILNNKHKLNLDRIKYNKLSENFIEQELINSSNNIPNNIYRRRYFTLNFILRNSNRINWTII